MNKATVSYVFLLLLPAYWKETVADTASDRYINCPEDWYYYGGKCYWGGGKENVNELTYTEAKTTCAQHGAKLVSIHSKEQQDFLTSYLVLNTGTLTFTGLTAKNKGETYEWEDGSPVNFTAWAKGQPNIRDDEENCVSMSFMATGQTGRWFSNYCHLTNAYICEKDSDPSLTSHNKMYCPLSMGGGYSLQQSCYHIVNEPMTWTKAEEFCQVAHSGHLIDFQDFSVGKFIAYILRQKNLSKKMWIGLKAPDDVKKESWQSGWPLSFTAWKDTSTYKKLTGNTCAILTESSVWDVKSCEEKYPFICEYSTSQPPLRPPSTVPGSYCPSNFNGWKDLGGDLCYFFSASTYKKIVDANIYCQQKGGHLASIHNKETLQMLEPFMRFYNWVYIGLIRQDDGQFAWLDGTEVDFDFWAGGEPNDIAEAFVVIKTESMDLYGSPGTYENAFVCSIKKILPEVTTSQMEILCSGELYLVE